MESSPMMACMKENNEITDLSFLKATAVNRKEMDHEMWNYRNLKTMKEKIEIWKGWKEMPDTYQRMIHNRLVHNCLYEDALEGGKIHAQEMIQKKEKKRIM